MKLQQCTDNVAIPIWLMATASTRYTFTQRRTTAPAMPADTRTLINLMQEFLLEDRVHWTTFEMIEATPDAMIFCGRLFYNMLHIAAHIKVETTKFMPPSGNGGAWRVKKISLASANDKSTSHYLHARSWIALRALLLAFPHTPQFHVLSNNDRVAGYADTLSTVILRGVDHHPAVTFEIVAQDLGRGSPRGRRIGMQRKAAKTAEGEDVWWRNEQW